MVDLKEILKLSVEEKISLVETIWNSIDVEQGESLLTKDQEDELDRRIKKHERGEGKTYTWKEIEERLEFKTRR